MSAATSPAAVGPPVRRRLGPVAWARENLFANWRDTIVTLVAGAVVGWALVRALRFVFVTGRWEVVRRNLLLFMVFRFPRDQVWRLWVAALVAALAVGLGSGMAQRVRRATRIGGEERESVIGRAPGAARRLAPLGLLVVTLLSLTRTLTPVLLLVALAAVGAGAHFAGRLVPVGIARRGTLVTVAGVLGAFAIIAGFGGVGPDRWGGLLLTLVLATSGIILSFPLGVLLALGRRSSLPAVRLVCVAYIELIRGVPLVALLFMGALVIGLFVPRGYDAPEVVTRVLIAIVLFTSAYIAEIVRGGLQSVQRGQFEAAQALALTPTKAMRLVVLPQALRAVIPATVGQFISLFKDTSLVVIVGLTELLGVGRLVTSQPDFLAQGLIAETLAFVGFIYWVGSYSMSRESQRLEARLGVGER